MSSTMTENNHLSTEQHLMSEQQRSVFLPNTYDEI